MLYVAKVFSEWEIFLKCAQKSLHNLIYVGWVDNWFWVVRGAEQSARMRRSEVNSAQEIGIWKQHISALPPVNTLTDATRQQRDRNRPQIPRKRRRVLKLWPWGWNLEILQTFLIQLLNEPISVWAGCVLVWMLQGLVTTFYMLYRCGIQNLGSEVLFFFFFLLAPLKSTRGRHRPRLISMKLNQTELLLQPAATIQRSTLIAPPNFTLNWTNCWFFLSLCGVFNRENSSERTFFFLFFFSFTGDSSDPFSPPHTGFQDETIWWVSAITLEYFASQISTAFRVLGSLSGAAQGVVLQYKPRPSGPTSSLKLTLVSHTNKLH